MFHHKRLELFESLFSQNLYLDDRFRISHTVVKGQIFGLNDQLLRGTFIMYVKEAYIKISTSASNLNGLYLDEYSTVLNRY